MKNRISSFARLRVRVIIRPDVILWHVCTAKEESRTSRKRLRVEIPLQRVNVLSFLVLVGVSMFDILPLKCHRRGVSAVTFRLCLPVCL